MFASIRRYRLTAGAMEDLTSRVDSDFAEQISAQPGFVSYEFIDCGNGDIATISVFRDADQADASRDLAQRWTDEHLADFEFTRLGAMSGEIMVSRAAREMLEPGHVGMQHMSAGIRRYRADAGAMREMMHIADTEFADAVAELDGFEAYHAIDGGDEVLAICMMRDPAGIEQCDRIARTFVHEKLAAFDIERVETLAGEVIVSRAMAELLEPAHA